MRVMREISEAKWSGKVDTKWTPPEGLFTGSAKEIAAGLMKGAKDEAQAMARLNYYINRAGKKLAPADRKRIDTAKQILMGMGEGAEPRKGLGAVLERMEAKASSISEERRWEGKFIGRDVRVQYSRGEWLIEELPQKGKRRLRKADVNVAPFLYNEPPFLAGNMIREVGFRETDDYDDVKAKITKLIEKGYAELEKTPKWASYVTRDVKAWWGKAQWHEEQVPSARVKPEGEDPIEVKGKDFTMRVEYDDFKTCSPESDFQSHDPSYTCIKAKSAAAAKKLYMLLKEKPTALAGVSWSKLSDWLKKNKIAFEYQFSVWN